MILASLSLLSCKSYEEIKVTQVEGFYMDKITTEKLEAEIKLKINNPNSVGFSIYPSEFEIIFSDPFEAKFL